MYFKESSELEFLYNAANACEGKTIGRDAVWQIAPVFASIKHNPHWEHDLKHFEGLIEMDIPHLFVHGKNRAKKAYEKLNNTVTKPSYIRRLVTEYPGESMHQLKTLEASFVNEPGSGGLVFSVFHPNDIINKKRPGYVPCLVSGSFLLHRGELQLNVFFPFAKFN